MWPVKSLILHLKCSLHPRICSTSIKIRWGRGIWAGQTCVFVGETNWPSSNCLHLFPSVCLWTKYRTSLSFIFHRQSGNSSIHVLTLQWELWKTLCVKCLTWCLASHMRATDRNTSKKKGKERNWSQVSRAWIWSLDLPHPGSASKSS